MDTFFQASGISKSTNRHHYVWHMRVLSLVPQKFGGLLLCRTCLYVGPYVEFRLREGLEEEVEETGLGRWSNGVGDYISR